MSSRKKTASFYPAQSIVVSATLTQRIAPTVFRATLPNGKSTVAYMPHRAIEHLGNLQSGNVVQLVLSPANMDTARITERAPV